MSRVTEKPPRISVSYLFIALGHFGPALVRRKNLWPVYRLMDDLRLTIRGKKVSIFVSRLLDIRIIIMSGMLVMCRSNEKR